MENTENLDKVFSDYIDKLKYPKEKLEFYLNEVPKNKISLIKALISYETKNINATKERCEYLFNYIKETNKSSLFINNVFWAMQSDISIEKLDEIINECETPYELIEKVKENNNYNISRFNGLLVEAEMLEKEIKKHKEELEQIQNSIKKTIDNPFESLNPNVEELKEEMKNDILEIISKNESEESTPIINLDEIEEELTEKILSKVMEELPINLEINELEELKKELEEEKEKRIQAENEANKYFNIICESLNKDNEKENNVKEIFGSEIDTKKLNTKIDKEPDIRKKIFNFKSDNSPIEMKITQLMIKRKYSADTINKVTFAVKSETVDKYVMYDMVQNAKNEFELNTFLEMI